MLLGFYWDISYAKISEEMDRQTIKEDQISALFCIRWYAAETSKPYEERTALKKLEKLKEVKKARELLCHAIFLYFEYRNYVSSDKALLILGNLLQNVPAEFQNETMVFFELLTSAAFSGMSGHEKADTKDNVSKRLISEVFSLAPMKLKKTAAEDWNKYGVPTEFSKFVSIARSAWSACREFVEGLLFFLFCATDDAKALDVEEFEKAYEFLPFSSKPNYLMGLVILELMGKSEKKEGKGDHPLAGPSKEFALAEDLMGDIRRAFAFWKLIIGLIGTVYTHKAIDQERYDRFLEADKFLEGRLEAIGINDMIKSK